MSTENTPKKNIAMVDDHTMLREGLQQLIDSQPDLRCCSTTSNTQDALRELEGGVVNSPLPEPELGESSIDAEP